MYARLWWKDARQFWPIWVVLLLAAAATQWLMLIFVGRQVRLRRARHLGPGLGGPLRTGGRGRGFRRGARNGHASAARHLARRSAGRLGGQGLIRTRDDPALTLVLLVMAAVSTERWNPQHPLTPLMPRRVHVRAGGAGMGPFLVVDPQDGARGRAGGDVLHRS